MHSDSVEEARTDMMTATARNNISLGPEHYPGVALYVHGDNF